LIVEDEPSLRDFYRVTLRGAGFNVLAVADGIDALRHVEQELPDVIVLDLGLPLLHGLDFHDELRAHPTTRHIPVVIVTGADFIVVNARAVAAVLTKPVEAEELVQAVETATRRRSRASYIGPERRRAVCCPSCGSHEVRKDTTLNVRQIVVTWRCCVCAQAWPERRRAA
jgi:DNA-binding response OmpR family regulator